ncbi:MAG: acyl carrier protein [Candidatus Aminicenantes bacterium]|nr:MAG: acyl carrier protein [Candidatus Aminicenantes bacterium]
MKEIKVKIKDFLSRFFREYDLEDDEDIFSVGFINSLFAMQLIMFLEMEFGIRIDNNELELDPFRTINNMARLIENKLVQVN